MRWLVLLFATAALGCAEGGGTDPRDDDGGSGGAGGATSAQSGGGVADGGQGGGVASGGGVMHAIWINEIHYDNEGLDTGEGVEVAGTAGLDLSPYAIELYNGDNGELYDTLKLNGTFADQMMGFGTAWLSVATNGLQNGGMDGLALVSTTTSEVLQFLSYEGTLTPTTGTASGLTSTDIGLEQSEATPVGESLQLVGFGGQYSEFTWNAATATPNAPNVGQGFQ